MSVLRWNFSLWSFAFLVASCGVKGPPSIPYGTGRTPVEETYTSPSLAELSYLKIEHLHQEKLLTERKLLRLSLASQNCSKLLELIAKHLECYKEIIDKEKELAKELENNSERYHFSQQALSSLSPQKYQLSGLEQKIKRIQTFCPSN